MPIDNLDSIYIYAAGVGLTFWCVRVHEEHQSLAGSLPGNLPGNLLALSINRGSKMEGPSFTFLLYPYMLYAPIKIEVIIFAYD